MPAWSTGRSGWSRVGGASAVAVVAILLLLCAGGFVAYRFYAAGATKMEIDKEAPEALERAFKGQPIAKVAADYKAFASERGCEANDGPPHITLEPSENPDKGLLTYACSMRVDLLVLKVSKSVRIEASRKRSGAFRTIQRVRDSLERAQEKHDQRLEKRFRGAE